jgi:hypothetical protein
MNIKMQEMLTWKYHPSTIHEFLLAPLVKENQLAVFIANLQKLGMMK